MARASPVFEAAPREKTTVGADWVLPALAVAFAIYFLVSVDELAWEAKATGVLVSVALLALIFLLALREAVKLARGGARISFAVLIGKRIVAWERVAILLLCAVFIALIPWLGLTLGLFLLSGALMFALRAGSWRKIVLASGTISVTAYLLFIVLLNSRLPRGPVERLLAALF
jgi:hypothetical protein